MRDHVLFKGINMNRPRKLVRCVFPKADLMMTRIEPRNFILVHARINYKKTERGLYVICIGRAKLVKRSIYW